MFRLPRKPGLRRRPALIPQMLKMPPVRVHEAEPTQAINMILSNQVVQLKALQLTSETRALHVALPAKLSHHRQGLQVPL